MTKAPLDDPGCAGVVDHPHEADPPWQRCRVCGRAEAAHAESVTPYRPEVLPHVRGFEKPSPVAS